MSECSALDLSVKPGKSIRSDLTKENVEHNEYSDRLADVPRLETTLNSREYSESQLMEQREYLESNICKYSGNNPLKPRYEFICWMEENFKAPRLVRNYVPLLEDTIVLFKDDLRYKQDVTFINLLIKYIELQPNPLELYKGVYSQGIGTMCSILYIAWANAFKRNNNFKYAKKIYDIGIGYWAEPLEDLKNELKKCQITLESLVLSNQAVQMKNCPEFSSCYALTASQRSNTLNTKNDLLVKTKDSANPLSVSNNGTIKRAGMCSETPTSCEFSNNSVQESSTPFTAPKFRVHEDSGFEEKNETSDASVTLCVLQTVEEKLSKCCPIALFEPPDPKKRAMYPKEKIYAGGKEYQLEELRAAVYNNIYEANEQPDVVGCTFQEPNDSCTKENITFSIYQDEDDWQIKSSGEVDCQASRVLSNLPVEKLESLSNNNFQVKQHSNESQFTDVSDENVGKVDVIKSVENCQEHSVSVTNINFNVFSPNGGKYEQDELSNFGTFTVENASNVRGNCDGLVIHQTGDFCEQATSQDQVHRQSEDEPGSEKCEKVRNLDSVNLPVVQSGGSLMNTFKSPIELHNYSNDNVDGVVKASVSIANNVIPKTPDKDKNSLPAHNTNSVNNVFDPFLSDPKKMDAIMASIWDDDSPEKTFSKTIKVALTEEKVRTEQSLVNQTKVMSCENANKCFNKFNLFKTDNVSKVDDKSVLEKKVVVSSNPQERIVDSLIDAMLNDSI